MSDGLQRAHAVEVLRLRCSEVLYYVWDPIGVAEHVGARDEYDSYVPAIMNLLEEGTGGAELADELRAIQVRRMGLKGTSGRVDDAAALLVKWRRMLAPWTPT